jgi:RHS repeat-associated protein
LEHPYAHTADTDVLFAGSKKDSESDLNYMIARYMDSSIGRFTTPDPINAVDPNTGKVNSNVIGNPQHLNFYAYCSNNPVNRIDPYGLYESHWFWRATVPGQILYDQGLTEFENGNYGLAGLYLAGMVGEQVMFALSFGQSTSGSMAAKGVISSESTATKGLLNSFNDIVANPKALLGKTADGVAQILGEGWTKGHYGKTGTGWKFTKGDKAVFYHEGGRHVGSYYGYSSGATGKVKIVGPGYKPLPGDKATIISGD